jgi:3-oxoacyl-[acyl-carrier protein] reductase
MHCVYDPFTRLCKSIDAKKVDIVVGEIKKLGGDAIGVAGDVAADDFPKKVVDATIQYVLLLTIL